MGSKRQRRKEGRVDKISSLQSEILTRIISFLPPRDAARTCVLSKKWKYIYKGGKRNAKVAKENKWLDPPVFFFVNVLRFSDLRTTIPQLRGVCKSWRSCVDGQELFPVPKISVPASFPVKSIMKCLPQISSNFLIPKLYHKPNDRTCFYIHQHHYYLLSHNSHGPQAPWIIRVHETDANKWRLLDFSRIGMELFKAKPKLFTRINLLDCGIEQLHCSWNIVVRKGSKKRCISKKVVGGWDLKASNYIFSVLIELNSSKKLILLRMDKQGKFKVNKLFQDKSCNIIEIAYHKGQFYVFDSKNWKVGFIDPQQPIIQIEFFSAPGQAPETTAIDFHAHMLSCDNHLFLVIDVVLERQKKSLTAFVLKQLNWTRLDSLEDTIFFIGTSFCFGLPLASEKLPNWRPNLMCFLNKCGAFRTSMPNMPVGIDFKYKDYKESLKLYELSDSKKAAIDVSSDWKKYTGIFFPPPWVLWHIVCGPIGYTVKLNELGFE